jgi:hypothetical protein
VDGSIAFLEDNQRTINSFLPVTREFGFEPRVFERPLPFGNFCEASKKSDPSAIGAFVLDMHDKKIRNLSEIKLPQVSTMNGEAVGVAVAEKYLRTAGSPYRQTPIAFLTGYNVQPELQQRMFDLRKFGPVEVLDKRKGVVEFREFLKKVCSSRTEQTGDEALDIIIGVLSEYNLSHKQIAAVLGFRLENDSTWPNFLTKSALTQSIDVQDRIELLVDIKTRLEAIFGPNAKVQGVWLRKREQLLSNKTPLSLLTSGHHYQIAHVLSLLQRITG